MRIAPLLLAGSLVLGACRSASTNHLRLQARADDTKIAAGDTVTVVDDVRPQVVFASARIPIDGKMELPQLGLVGVTGRSPRDLAQDLTAQYRALYPDSRLSVDVVVPAGRFYVYGEVHLEGRYPLVQGVTMFEAVQAAHPDSYFADLTSVRLVRGEGDDERVLELDVRRMNRGDLTFNLPLQDGDIVFVPRTPVGHVLSPVMDTDDAEAPEVRRLRAGSTGDSAVESPNH